MGCAQVFLCGHEGDRTGVGELLGAVEAAEDEAGVLTAEAE